MLEAAGTGELGNVRIPIKQLGDYTVPVRLHREVTIEITVHVTREE